MTVGERIRKRRKELNMSVDKLSEILGKNRATIYRYESDEIENLPIPILEPLAKALNTSPSYLMGWNDGDYVKIQLDETLADKLQKVIYKYIPKFTDFISDTCNKLSFSDERITNEYFSDKSYELYTVLLNNYSGEVYNEWLHSCIENVEKFNNSITISIIENEINKLLTDKVNDISYNEFSSIIESINNEIHNIIAPEVLTVEFFKYKENCDADLTSSIYDIIEKNKTMSCLNNELINVIENELFYDVLSNVIANFAKQMNSVGQVKILDYTKDLLANERYLKNAKITKLPKKEETPEHLVLKAAHRLPNATEEDIQHDEDIMNDPDF